MLGVERLRKRVGVQDVERPFRTNAGIAPIMSIIRCTLGRTRKIESVDVEPAPLRLVLGTQALDSMIATLQARIAGFEAQRAVAGSTDFPPGE